MICFSPGGIGSWHSAGMDLRTLKKTTLVNLSATGSGSSSVISSTHKKRSTSLSVSDTAIMRNALSMSAVSATR